MFAFIQSVTKRFVFALQTKYVKDLLLQAAAETDKVKKAVGAP